MLTREDDGEEEKMMNCLSYKSDCLKSKERKRQVNIYGKEEGILGFAEYHIRRPMPSITTGASPTPRHGGWWRPIGAASHQPHARNFWPKATQAIGPNPVPTNNKETYPDPMLGDCSTKEPDDNIINNYNARHYRPGPSPIIRLEYGRQPAGRAEGRVHPPTQ
jgi:hypothetical protein